MTQIYGATERRMEALQVFEEFPGKISGEIQEKILANLIVLGMRPYDCYLAAGAFTFAVAADPIKWAANADPYKVMWTQSVFPDDSQISMTFETDSQYENEDLVLFRVSFKKGKAINIEKLDVKKDS